VKQLHLDLNVVLDVILERQPHAEGAARLWAALETRQTKPSCGGPVRVSDPATVLAWLVAE
jgi:hypothetical protein